MERNSKSNLLFGDNIVKEVEKNFQNLLENFPLSIFILENQTIKYLNCNAELSLKKKREELLDKNILDVFNWSSKKKKKIENIINDVLSFNLREIKEFKYKNSKDQDEWMEIFFSSVLIEGEKYVQLIIQDITEKKLAEGIIREENKKLHQLNEIKKRLTAKTSEELTSPLNVVANASEFLLNSYKDKLDQDAVQLLELINNLGNQSINLVEKMLDISKIEADKFPLQKHTISIIEIIKESINDVMEYMKNVDVNIKLEIIQDVYASVDRLRFEQVIKDLLLNAIKYTPKKGDIIVNILRVNNHVEITIETPKKIPFDDVKESYIEFNFSKEIIEKHKGQLIVENSNVSKGSKFIIKLPIKNWTELLIHLYIIYKAGIPLYDHTFVNIDAKNHPSSLVSGGIIGMVTILKEIVHSEKQLRTIDSGDRKIMFRYNNTEDIIFVLIVKEDLIIFEKKLDMIITDFDKIYKDLIEDIDNTSNLMSNWKNLDILVEKYFKDEN